MPARRIYFRVTMGIGTEIGRLKLQKKNNFDVMHY